MRNSETIGKSNTMNGEWRNARDVGGDDGGICVHRKTCEAFHFFTYILLAGIATDNKRDGGAAVCLLCEKVDGMVRSTHTSAHSKVYSVPFVLRASLS